MKSFVVNVKSPVGVWSVLGTDEGVQHIHLPHDELPSSKGVAPKPVADAAHQLEEYFAGTRRTFKVTLSEFPATSFQSDVWNALRAIPYGQVRTYGEAPQGGNDPAPLRRAATPNK